MSGTSRAESSSLATLAESIQNYSKTVTLSPEIRINDNGKGNLHDDDYGDDDTDNEGTTQPLVILPDFLEVDISDLEFYERCGNGAYGCVYRAKWISRDKEVAIKKLLQLDNEANVLNVISHRNIIRFYGVVNKAPNFCLITEYAKNGSLQAFIHKHRLHTEYGLDLILQWAKDIALGMNYLHSEAPVKKSIIHRDLKSTNVVISEDMVCKICDFGTSIFSLKTTKMSLIGTFPWMSPEIIQCKQVNNKCDIWSYGVVLWELITGQLPFKGLESFQIAYLIVERQQRLPIPTSCPTILKQLMDFCWQTEPKNRPSFREVLETLDQCCSKKNKDEINNQFETHKQEWELEIEIVFEKLKRIEQDLFKKEKILEERERKLREQEISLINNFKIITIEDYDVNSWREIDVYEWVKTICEDKDWNADIADLFLKNNINGSALLMLSKDDIENLGITSVGHRITLCNEIKHIKNENTRLLNFPPLKHAPSTSTQMSTKDFVFTVVLSAHILHGNSAEEHKWKMVFDIDEEDSKDVNLLLYIRDVKFVSRYPPFHQFNITKPPFKMPKWVKGIQPHSKVDCIITYEDKVIKPKNTKIEFSLNPENNISLMQEITITLENTSGSEPLSSANSTQSLTTALLNSHHYTTNSPAPIHHTVSEVWKKRTLENSIDFQDLPILNSPKPDSWSGIVTGKYKTDEKVQYRAQTSAHANLLRPETPKSANGSFNFNTVDKPAVYKRHNTFNEYSRVNRTYSSSKSNNSNGSSSFKPNRRPTAPTDPPSSPRAFFSLEGDSDTASNSGSVKSANRESDNTKNDSNPATNSTRRTNYRQQYSNSNRGNKQQYGTQRSNYHPKDKN